MEEADVTTAKLEATPNTWPGGLGLYKHSRNAVKLNLGTLFQLILWSFGFSIFFFIVTAALSGSISDVTFNIIDGVLNVVSYVVSFVLGVMTALVLLASVKEQTITVEESFTQSKEFLLSYFVLSILTFAAMTLSFILFIIPFFFVAPRLAIAQYYIFDKKLDPMEAFKASWRDMKGHTSKVYGIIGAGILMFIPVITLVGIPVTIYLLFMYQAAFAVLYMHVQKQTKNS